MATIVILQHAMNQHVASNYIMNLFAEHWRESGHSVLEHYGPETPPPGDLAILHVDVTVVPPEYRPLVSHYEHVINGAVLDISKRSFSQILVTKDSDWNGPVVVKTDANFYGRTEWMLHSIARDMGAPSQVPAGPVLVDYPIFASLRDVPERNWTKPGIIVEKFLPERDERGFYMRTWTFFGDGERSSRFRAQVPIIKSADILDREAVPVADEIRAWRKKLGFDYGKFDYVIHEGRPILLDTNRTPALPTNPAVMPQDATENYRSMADGISMFLP